MSEIIFPFLLCRSQVIYLLSFISLFSLVFSPCTSVSFLLYRLYVNFYLVLTNINSLVLIDQWNKG